MPSATHRGMAPWFYPFQAFLFLCAVLLALGGCQKTPRTSDPQLKPIQDMLDEQLPAGTPEANVLTFLGNRGYPVLPTGKQGTVVTTIRHIDTQTVTPVTARVTFYFDANRKLNTYEMQRTFNDPVPKAEEDQEASPPAPQQAQPTQQ
jgi:hypothetical protein